MTAVTAARRPFLRGLALACAAALGLAACGGEGEETKGGEAAGRDEIVFSILSAESQASSGPLWQPLLDDLAKATGVKVTPRFGSNYNVLIEAMRFDQSQVGWFSAKPALEAVERAEGEVIARTVDLEGSDSYRSTLIVKKGSGITLDRVLACGKQLDFGIGDAQSTSGTLAPMTFLFNPRNLVPSECFRTVRAANHQANSFAVATGVVDVATSNTVNTVFLNRQNPRIAAQIEEIWQSPPIPESGIVIREDLDPALKEKLRQFFLTYGKAEGAEGERQRQNLKALNYSEFRAASDGYLDPVREMRADQQLTEARASGNQQRITAAQQALNQLRAKREVEP
jgi:phosphonate transport system substrate-binding protein